MSEKATARRAPSSPFPTLTPARKAEVEARKLLEKAVNLTERLSRWGARQQHESAIRATSALADLVSVLEELPDDYSPTKEVR